MGWKNVKEHYRIEHFVQVREQGICIGSGYIHDIIVIGIDGKVVKRHDGRNNESLYRYMTEIDATAPEALRLLIDTPDAFDRSLAVYTYDGGNIIEKRCENYGWPNVTHDGEMMYENRFSADKAVVVAWAKRSAELGIRYAEEAVEETKRRLAECESRLASEKADLAKLDADYPASVSS